MAAAVLLPGMCEASVGGGPWIWRGVRVDDSKRLSPAQRERACRVILQYAEVGVGIVPADEIDRSDILRATFDAMRRAVEALPHPPDLILVDGNICPPRIGPSRAVIGGDRLQCSIACASIVAKVLRDSLMAFYHRLFPEWAFDRHKGYGTASHRAALSQWGLSPLHRLSFEPMAGMRRMPRPDPRAELAEV